MNRINIARDQLDQRIDVFGCNGLDPLFEIIDVPIERIDIQLNRSELVDARRGNPERLLQTLQDPLAIPEWCLLISNARAL